MSLKEEKNIHQATSDTSDTLCGEWESVITHASVFQPRHCGNWDFQTPQGKNLVGVDIEIYMAIASIIHSQLDMQGLNKAELPFLSRMKSCGTLFSSQQGKPAIPDFTWIFAIPYDVPMNLGTRDSAVWL